jgi:pilus assembly protein Flp/PilA
MMTIMKRFSKNESGATAIEYGLIAALIALAIMIGAGQLGTALDTQFSNIATAVTTGQAPGAGGGGGGEGGE